MVLEKRLQSDAHAATKQTCRDNTVRLVAHGQEFIPKHGP
jgi:hypothetical protein